MDDIRLGARLIEGTVAAKQILTILTKVFTRRNFDDTIALNAQSVAKGLKKMKSPLAKLLK